MDSPHLNRCASDGAPRLTAVIMLLVMAFWPARGFAQSPAQGPSQTPTEVFLAYRAALATATSYAELLPFMEAKTRGMVEAMPQPQQESMFGYMKKFAGTFTEVAVAEETITGDAALLALSGKDPKGQAAAGSVPLTKEATGWKVGAEKWSSAPRRR